MITGISEHFRLSGYFGDLCICPEIFQLIIVAQFFFKNVYDKKVTTSEEEDVNSLFSKLKLNSEKTNIEKDSGSVTVYATFDVKCKRGEIIDGSIKAVLYNKKGEEAGCAYLYLPVSGTAGEKSISMNGMCAEPKKYGPYTVKFEPINLWKVKKA